MFEATLLEAGLLKNILESVKDLVTEANFECSSHGISLQAMDTSHVSLVNLLLRADGFEHYRCDKNMSLGINMASMAKILKCANNDDKVTLKATESTDKLTFLFENQKKVQDFELKLLEIDNESLGIPDTEYNCEIKTPSGEFQKICRNLAMFGDTVVIAADNDGVKFTTSGESSTSNMMLKPCSSADSKDDENTVIENSDEPIALTFALRYLNYFTKATGLSPSVKLSMAPDVPLVVEYKMEELGYVRYYLAPKIDDE
eukprot:TRINITY_DN30219_c0_g1_i1.p1 TRINITY_DN30219_c0_g1~~TRINITY_DN30219_c0_g1_i1.p1  ORF type:complete len:259 (-),score=49.93 TRINITY_DN30219_c0_g1_i1:42-818(-)